MNDWGAIFDWDGVIIDSSRQHEQAWQLHAAALGRVLPTDYFKRSFGMKNEKAIVELLQWATDPVEVKRISKDKEALYRQLVRQQGAEALPGVLSWLRTLQNAGVPCVVGSSTHAENIQCVIDSLGVADCFRAMVCAEDVHHGKPHPEVFLLAAQKIGMPPKKCVVFEDAHVGIQAARAAGMKVIALATTHPAETLQDADKVVKNLEELTLADIAGLFAN
jgi:beta-phosphoglucomutase